jgi:hypothetical protein
MIVVAIVVVFFTPVVVVASEVHADVEAVMIPICLVILAPLAGRLHSVHIRIDLAATLAMPADVAVDPRAISFQPPVAIIFPVVIRASRAAERQCQAACQRAGKNDSTP